MQRGAQGSKVPPGKQRKRKRCAQVVLEDRLSSSDSNTLVGRHRCTECPKQMAETSSQRQDTASNKRNWGRALELQYINYLLEWKRSDGRWYCGRFQGRNIWSEIRKDFNRRCGINFTHVQLKSKWNRMKTLYNIMKSIRYHPQFSGLGWNFIKGNVVADENVWNQIILLRKMARTKNPGKETVTEQPLDELLRQMWPVDEDDSKRDGQLKKKPAEDRSRFVSRWVEINFRNTWGSREVVPGKPPRIEDVEQISGFMEIMKHQGWTRLFDCDFMWPELVQLFFSNMIVHIPKLGGMEIRSYVKGVEVCLLSYDINEMFQLDCDTGFMVSDITKDELNVLLTEAYNFLCGGDEPNLNAMNMCARAVSFVICQFIQGRQGKELTDYDYILTYKAMSGEKNDFGDVFFFNLHLTHSSNSRKLPYGGILTAMFEMLGVDHCGHETIVIRNFFGRKNLSSIMGKRKRGGVAECNPSAASGRKQVVEEPSTGLKGKSPAADEGAGLIAVAEGKGGGERACDLVQDFGKRLQNIEAGQEAMKQTLAQLMRSHLQFKKQTTEKLNRLVKLLEVTVDREKKEDSSNRAGGAAVHISKDRKTKASKEVE